MEIKARLIHDTKNCRWWYEELIGNRWVKIPKTDMACEGNATHELELYIQRKREEHYKLYHEIEREITFSLDFD